MSNILFAAVIWNSNKEVLNKQIDTSTPHQILAVILEKWKDNMEM